MQTLKVVQIYWPPFEMPQRNKTRLKYIKLCHLFKLYRPTRDPYVSYFLVGVATLVAYFQFQWKTVELSNLLTD